MDIDRNFICIPLNGDRLGGQLTYSLAYIFYAKHFNIPLKYQTNGLFSNNIHINSIFMLVLDEWIDEYNKNIIEVNNNALNNFIYSENWYEIMIQTLKQSKLILFLILKYTFIVKLEQK
jgi:hypothetical protein